jgi:SAM-dependent methyltransferase
MDTKTRQLEIIRKRYGMTKFNVVHQVAAQDVKRRLSWVATPDEFVGKRVLELGAGCSPYTRIFLEYGCRSLVANDLIPERLALNGINDPAYKEVPGDLLTADFGPEKFDIIFANLTMVLLVPMMDEVIERTSSLLAPGGKLITIEPNHFCPRSLYRRFADRSGANAERFFNPFSYAKAIERRGLTIEKIVPFTSNLKWTVGSWLLGTSFGLKARKPGLISRQN